MFAPENYKLITKKKSLLMNSLFNILFTLFQIAKNLERNIWHKAVRFKAFKPKSKTFDTLIF